MFLRYGNVLVNLNQYHRIYPEEHPNRPNQFRVMFEGRADFMTVPVDDFTEGANIINVIATALEAGKTLCVIL